MTLITLGHPILPLSIQQDSLFSAQYSDVEFCFCFQQSLYEGSLMTIRVVTNLITGDGSFRLSTTLQDVTSISQFLNIQFEFHEQKGVGSI